jgi:hypothetical protein
MDADIPGGSQSRADKQKKRKNKCQAHDLHGEALEVKIKVWRGNGRERGDRERRGKETDRKNHVP